MSGPELIIASTALSTLNALREGRAAQTRSETAARRAEANAQAARQRARLAASEERRRGSAAIASRRARLIGSGADLSGTPVDVLGQLAADQEFAALRAADAGNLQAFNQMSRAGISRARGQTARRANLFRAGSSLLRAGAAFGR